MRKFNIYLIILFLVSIFDLSAQSTAKNFNTLNTEIRDQVIKKDQAKKEFSDLIDQLDKEYLDKVPICKESDMVFPLIGYSKKEIGGITGSGFVIANYDYFDGNKHSGHPAHDIFIYDKNQDCLDDRTKKPVGVVSISSGVVVALEKSWDLNSGLRGGKYILIYDPNNKLFFYYAHNNVVKVNVGDIVKPGQLIAEVGRTGLNAFKKRSPTHLHLMTLKIG